MRVPDWFHAVPRQLQPAQAADANWTSAVVVNPAVVRTHVVGIAPGSDGRYVRRPVA